MSFEISTTDISGTSYGVEEYKSYFLGAGFTALDTCFTGCGFAASFTGSFSSTGTGSSFLLLKTNKPATTAKTKAEQVTPTAIFLLNIFQPSNIPLL